MLDLLATYPDTNVPIILLIFARTLAMLQIAPVISAPSIPFAARAGISFFTAIAISPLIISAGYALPASGLEFGLFIFIEILIGIIMGFYLVMVFAILTTAAQMFSMQMGYAAAEMFDPMADTESALIGQFLNFGAFLIFISTYGMQKLFLMGVQGSFHYLSAATLVLNPELISTTMVQGLAMLFSQAIIIALPMIGSLFLLSVALGLMAKAAPQMNLLMVGFPLQVGLGLMMLALSIPAIFNAFGAILNRTWDSLGRFIIEMGQ